MLVHGLYLVVLITDPEVPYGNNNVSSLRVGGRITICHVESMGCE